MSTRSRPHSSSSRWTRPRIQASPIHSRSAYSIQTCKTADKGHRPQGRDVSRGATTQTAAEWGPLSPDHCQEQDIDVLLADVPVRTVEKECTGSAIRQEEQNQPAHVSRTEGMSIKTAFQTTKNWSGLPLGTARRERRGERLWPEGMQRRPERTARPHSFGTPKNGW